MRPKRILFYSSVKNKKLFLYTGFYVTDIEILRDLGFIVNTSNKLLDFLMFWNYDIAFIYFYRYGVIGGVLSRLFGKKVYFTGGIDDLDLNYHKSNKRYNIQKLLFYLGYHFSTKCIIVSKADFKNIKIFFKKTKKLVYLPHVIKTEKYKFDNREKQNICLTIVWMGNIENVVRKGVDKSLILFSNFLKFQPDFKFYIIGTKGEGTKYLINLIKKYNIPESKIIFTGSIDEEDKIELLKNSKYYFQLSKYEGFGIAALEALCAGSIVIHSGKGGLKDIIGGYGIIFDSGNIYKFCQKLNKFEKNYALRKDFTKNGIDYVCQEFTYNVRKNGFQKILIDS